MADPFTVEAFASLYNEKAALLGRPAIPPHQAVHYLQEWQKKGRTTSAAIRRIIARSPLNTIQEQQIGLPFEEWRILVVCILLNRTHGRQVRPIIDELFERWPTPKSMVEATPGLTDLIRPLGFSARRTICLKDMSADYLALTVDPSKQLDGSWANAIRGCGQYAVDSLNVFRYGILKNVSSDTWINDYIQWRSQHE